MRLVTNEERLSPPLHPGPDEERHYDVEWNDTANNWLEAGRLLGFMLGASGCFLVDADGQVLNRPQGNPTERRHAKLSELRVAGR